jgi:hypothetical protein
VLAPTKEHVLFEMTAQAAEPVADYAEANGTLRGCVITAQRAQQRTNGRVLISCSPADLSKIKLPAPPDMIRALCQIWGTAYPLNGQTVANPDRRSRTLRVLNEASGEIA